MSRADTDPVTSRACERTYPLNSRRLTTDVVGRLAGSLEETRLMLEGKLLEREQEPRNVQVVIKETAEGSMLSLPGRERHFPGDSPSEKRS